MTMKMTQNKPLVIAFALLLMIGSAFWFIRPKLQTVKFQQAQGQKLQQIKELAQAADTDPKYREHNSQASRELSNKLTSHRPPRSVNAEVCECILSGKRNNYKIHMVL